jgi:lambda family phage portal protein
MDTPSDLFSSKNIRKGVEIGEYGEPVGYWIRKTHPGDIFYGKFYSSNVSSNYYRYDALDGRGMPKIFHLYHVLRSGQTRGEPFFAPVINLFKDRFEYMEAELVAARVAACFAVFVKKQLGPDQALVNSTVESDGRRTEELSPGLFEYLAPGEDITSFNPNRPGGTFGMFMERILRDISAGINVPYEILAKDFTKSNYSNMRASLLEARRFFMMQQRFIANKLCQPVLRYLVEEAYLKGELPILDFYQKMDEYVRSRWVAPGWEWIDPQAEVGAAVDAVNNNLSTLAEEAAAQGRDWEDDLEQRARELKRIKDLENKNGIKMAPQPVPGAIKPQPKNTPPATPPAVPDNQPQPGDNPNGQ